MFTVNMLLCCHIHLLLVTHNKNIFLCEITVIGMFFPQMLQKSSEKAELLSIVLKCTFDVMSKKQKTRQALHPLLYIVNKGIVLRLTKGKLCTKDLK